MKTWLMVVVALMAVGAAACGGGSGPGAAVSTPAAADGAQAGAPAGTTNDAAGAPSASGEGTVAEDAATGDTDAGAAPWAGGAAGPTRNLIFIHHSCGENWLNDGLCRALNEKGYHVADISYGWAPEGGDTYGDRTDTGDWPVWFTEEVMGPVYREMDAMTAPNALEPAPGENTIVMFKSCFPNSDVGSDISDEQAVYNSLLPYFEAHPDKMFVLVTPPPMQSISDPAKTRELCDWLTDRDTGWLAALSTANVFVFDLYNVLTHPDAHHRLADGVEVHESVPGSDTLYYPSGDDHPSAQGNLKATDEFIGLLDLWYQSFAALQG